MNDHITTPLKQLVTVYQTGPSEKVFQIKALQRAIKSIAAHPTPITCERDALEVPGVGKGIARRIVEIIETGGITELDGVGAGAAGASAHAKAIEELTQITGIGPKKAAQFVSEGITTIPALKEAHELGRVKLTHHMLVGLQYHEDLQHRIPRTEVQRLEGIIAGTIRPGTVFQVCGSYRRGAETCGDIDILIAEPGNEEDASDALTELVQTLIEAGILVDSLTFKGGKKYMGVGIIDHHARRIDIRYIPWSAYYPALIYFTGSKNFNISIRRTALEKGYSLSEYGLKGADGQSITFNTEEELFELLGLDYVPPTEREMGK